MDSSKRATCIEKNTENLSVYGLQTSRLLSDVVQGWWCKQVDGKFEQLKGEIKKTWGKLTDNDVMLFNGQKDKFFGKLKEMHGVEREEAEKKMAELEKTCVAKKNAA